MTKKNMRDFNRAAALVLSLLHDNFPRPVSLDVAAFDDGADRETMENFAHTVIFLEQEGFLRHEGLLLGGDGFFSSAVLTAKGLAALAASPDAIRDKTDNAGRLKKVLESGSMEALKAAVAAVIKAAAGQLA